MALEVIPIPPDTANIEALPKLIRRRELARTLGMSRSMTYLKGNPDSRYFDPLFPVPIRIGARMQCFFMADVEKYLHTLVQKRLAAQQRGTNSLRS
jgi:predicted DNA-binding transcriptional regulator AlpA